MNIPVEKHYRGIRKILIIVLFLNWGVALAKIIYGLSSHSSSMTADGMHSLSDGASNIICLIGIHFACQPVDKDHPYGHKKYETFFSLGISLLLFILSLDLIKGAVERMHNPIAPQIELSSFLVMVLTTTVNICVMKYEFRKGKQLQSDILISDSIHTKADIFTSIAVIMGFFIIKLGYPIADPIITIIIALFISYSGFEVAKQSSNVLCDTAVILDVNKISDVVLKVKGVKSCHKIRTRGRPDDIHVDLHVQVSPNMHIDQAHKISYGIEAQLKEDIPEITDVVVHMEPQEKSDSL